MNRPARPQVKATVGGRPPSTLGIDGLLDFTMEVTLDGETLSAAEIKRLLAHSDGLALIRGKWVEVDHARLSRTLEQFEAIERRASTDGLSFGEAMRMLAGAGITGDEAAAPVDVAWSETVAGPWLAETLAALRSPDGRLRIGPGRSLNGALRPYQLAGMQWLYLLARLGLGACLADDMGLGKTIQVLSLLLVLKNEAKGKPSLLVAPASLLANWAAEIGRFAPSLAGGGGASLGDASAEALQNGADLLAGVDLAITSYGYLARAPWLCATSWRLVVLDEAQAIKNPGAKQTRTVKQLKADARIALTGTPIENRLGDLWSIFDFINPGLLGSSKQFSSFVKSLAARPHNPYGPLRELVRPYILRRLKTDKSIIADLPDKTEVKAFCLLSRKQAALYQQAVKDLSDKIERSRRHRAQGRRARLPDAVQADLQPSLPMAGRRRLGRGGQRQAGAAARDRRGNRRAPGEGPGLHPVPGDDSAAGDVPRRGVRPSRPRPAWRDRGQEAQGRWCGSSRRTRAFRFSCSR